MKKRLWVLLAISVPALLIIFFAGLASGKRGKESLRSVLEQAETASARFNQLQQRVVDLSDSDEIKAGSELDSLTRESYDVLDDKDLHSKYVSDVGQYLTAIYTRRRIPFHFYVVNSTDINAYSLPGGYVYITTGLLAMMDSEAELASVLGHEIGHIDLYHCADKIRLVWLAQKGHIGLEKLVGVLSDFIERGFSKQHEHDADIYGMLLAAKCTYQPQASTDLFIKMTDTVDYQKQKEHDASQKQHRNVGRIAQEAIGKYLATHPDLDERIAMLKGEIDQRRAEWQSSKFYRGRHNLKDLKSMQEVKYQSEWETIK